MRKLLGAVVMAVALTTTMATVSAGAAEPGLEADFVAGINRVRAEAGLHPLQVHDELTAVARNWADTMAAANDIWHNPDLGSQVSAPWVVLGENVGTGPEVGVIMQAFVDSPPHYRNLVEPRYDWVGVGVTWGSDGRMYTAHVFMDLGDDAPAPAPPASGSSGAPAAPAPAPAPAPAAPVTAAPPAAAEPQRVVTVLAAVAAIGAAGVA